MTDYKAIHGKNILHVASDLDSAEGEGQIWFNTTSSDYKTITKVAGAWASGGFKHSKSQTRWSAGIQTAAAAFGGGNSEAETEVYNGSAWTESGDLNTGRGDGAGLGLSTAALFVGGETSTAYVAINESYDGSSWTETGDLNAEHEVH